MSPDPVWVRGSLLGLEAFIVGLDESLDLVRHAEELQPLLLVESHWKAAHAINRERAFLADLHGELAATRLFQTLILSTQALQLGLKILGHSTLHKRLLPGLTLSPLRESATSATPRSWALGIIPDQKSTLSVTGGNVRMSWTP